MLKFDAQQLITFSITAGEILRGYGASIIRINGDESSYILGTFM